MITVTEVRGGRVGTGKTRSGSRGTGTLKEGIDGESTLITYSTSARVQRLPAMRRGV